MQPGVERLRPPQATPVANLFLAGDWTSTGWPSTMEGAVRSGRLAVDALFCRLGSSLYPAHSACRLFSDGTRSVPDTFMRIAYLIAGAVDVLRQLHARQHAGRALCAAGQDCLLAPLYTPIRTDEESVSIDRVMCGGINVYLQQRWAIFRHTPWFFDRLFDHASLLRRAAGRSQNVRPEHLVRDDGLHAARRRRAAAQRSGKTRALARPRSPPAGRPSEHGAADRAGGKSRGNWQSPWSATCRAKTPSWKGFPSLIAAARWKSSAEMRGRSDGPGGHESLLCRLHGHASGRVENAGSRGSTGIELGRTWDAAGRQSPIRIGYLARICPEKGLKTLAGAVRRLADDPSVPPVHVRAAGYLDPADRPYLLEIEREIAAYGLADRFQYAGELDRPQKITFLQACDVFTLPTTHPEAKGLSVFEAWANAVPAVLPAHGAFPEMVADTGGGVLYSPADPAGLAAVLKQMILDPGLAEDCGRRAQQTVRERYNMEKTAQRMIEVYRQFVTV